MKRLNDGLRLQLLRQKILKLSRVIHSNWLAKSCIEWARATWLLILILLKLLWFAKNLKETETAETIRLVSIIFIICGISIGGPGPLGPLATSLKSGLIWNHVFFISCCSFYDERPHQLPTWHNKMISYVFVSCQNKISKNFLWQHQRTLRLTEKKQAESQSWLVSFSTLIFILLECLTRNFN